MLRKSLLFISSLTFLLVSNISYSLDRQDGFILKGGTTLFPIGFYELPKDDAQLKAMAESGVNLVRCHSVDDLDRAQSAGLLGVAPLPFHNGATESLEKIVHAMKGHPALVAWEGPDEIAWNFTAASRLFRTQKIHKVSGAWWKQTPEAVEYARKQAGTIIPNMRAAVELIRKLDKRNRPVWINEALESDLAYVRRYLPFVDITGCDIYPVKKTDRRIHRMAGAVERWKRVGRGRPVWMVLQAFSWNELGDYYGVKDVAYPTFHESRFMAYDVIAHGSKGILYWGSHYLKSEPFRQSLYALTAELAAIQPFLTAPEAINLNIDLAEIENPAIEETRGVVYTVRRFKQDWLVILVNEDDRWHHGVELEGLEQLSGKTLYQLYGDNQVQIEEGALTTRMGPYDVQIYSTSKDWESSVTDGRHFVDTN